MATAANIAQYAGVENAGFKYLVWDESLNQPKNAVGNPRVSLAEEKKVNGNLQMKDGLDGSDIAPALSLLENCSDVLSVSFDDFSNESKSVRGVSRTLSRNDRGSRFPVTTVFDLLMAQFRDRPRVCREIILKNYDDDQHTYTPGPGRKKFTGIDRAKCHPVLPGNGLQTAEKNRRKNVSIIIGCRGQPLVSCQPALSRRQSPP